MSAALAMAIEEPTRMLCFFLKSASCVCMDADIWFQISGLTFGVRSRGANIDLALFQASQRSFYSIDALITYPDAPTNRFFFYKKINKTQKCFLHPSFFFQNQL